MRASPELVVDLASRQRQLRDLIKGRTVMPADADPYLRAVAASPGLAMMREIVLWWRVLGIERACPFTAAALMRQGRFDQAVAAFIQAHALTPYRDELGPRFLVTMENDCDQLIAAVARFELALIRVKRGEPDQYVIDWPNNPYVVLQALASDSPFDEHGSRGIYQTVVSSHYPRLFQVLRSGRTETT